MRIVQEADGWSAFLPGVPVGADGATRDEALEEFVDALRAYADDWEDHLGATPNHREHEGLVQLVRRCDDDQLRGWLVAQAVPRITVDAETGFPLFSSGRPISSDDVPAMLDEE